MANPSIVKKPSAEEKAERIGDQVLALDVKRVADWIQALVRTLKAYRMYLPNNPTLHKFQSDLEARTWSCLKEIGDIVLNVQQFDLLFEDYSVYHNAAREESLAFRFYTDGVRQITFREGLEPQELRGILEVLKKATDPTQGQDDVVTLLWERDFRHVEYVHISIDEIVEEGSGADYPPDPNAPDGGGIPWPVSSVAAEQEAPIQGPEETVVDRSDDWSPKAKVEATWDESSVGIQFNLTDQETRALNEAIRVEEERPLLNEVLEIVSAILKSEEEPTSFLESATSFQKFIEQALEEGDLARANELLSRLRTIAAKRAETHGEFRALTEQVIREIGRPSFLGQFAPILNAHPELDPALLTNFLVQIGPTAAGAVCDLLGQVNHMKHRRALCEALAISCKDDVDVLISRLGDSRWYVIRNVVYVLGRIAHQGVERALDRALHHEDVRVRKEAVRALGNIESPTSRAFLVSAFRDLDASVRVQAALTLAQRRDDRAAQSLWGAIQAPDFAKRDQAERQVFFEALGKCASDAFVPRLSELITKAGLFRGPNEEERFSAALALAWLGTPKALEVLNRELQSKKEQVRRSIETALETVRNAALGKGAKGPADDDAPAQESGPAEGTP
ncbi:MAG: HEAT repeat domain-containing protein [Candidatus Eisenbacteria bacterium]|uniref:HEAT repeat domain-containing protein n=1 Tax=Eiseniibacteriota bacterium TaxID=2212470 RepID=A0A538T897_UNCEI|nr:MAG: HEAT repeat domain-containing protein [Candidatus Eisenbacteria bacterium]TMQ59870.1 MAG: HEAT repeat domain-containing protein [Candidatus Eisenbacteria bacterium]